MGASVQKLQHCKNNGLALHSSVCVCVHMHDHTHDQFSCTRSHTHKTCLPADISIYILSVSCVYTRHTHVITSEVEKSSVPSRPRRQSAFFLWRWCISPPQLSQQRHMQKKRPTIGTRMANSRPTAAHTRNPIS